MKNPATVLFIALLSVVCSYSFAQAAAPNDAQIAGIVVAANSVDIDAGKLAKSMSHNSDVKGFAQRMITDHSGVNKEATALVKKLKMTPEDSDTSKSLKDGGTSNISKLKGLKGKDHIHDQVEKDHGRHEWDGNVAQLCPTPSAIQFRRLVKTLWNAL